MSSDKLTVIPSQYIDTEIQQNKQVTLETIERLASYFIDSKLYGVGDPKALIAQAVVKMLAGKELGIPPFMAMKEIYIIPSSNGNRFMYSANLIARLIKQSKLYNFKIVKLTNQECSIDFFENGQLEGNSTFTIQDATQAGLDKNATYVKFPRNMLRNRALTNGAMWFCPLLGLGTVDGIIEEGQTESQEDLLKLNLIKANQDVHQILVELELIKELPNLENLSIQQLKQLLSSASEQSRSELLRRLKAVNPDTYNLLQTKDLPDLYLLYNQSVITVTSNKQ